MFSSLPPKFSVPIFYFFISIRYVAMFLFGNIYGIFVLAIFLYFNSENILGSSPLNFDQLMFWLVSQSETAKTALLSSFVTVIGFMLAYATATANWKGQLLANLKMQAASEIDSFFTEFSKLASECQFFASALSEAVDEIQKGCSLAHGEFLAQYNRDQGQIFVRNRQRLVAMGIEVHNFHGRYATLLFSAPGLKSSLDTATQAVTAITERLWINVPFHIQDDPNPIQSFVNQVNVAECLALKDTVNTHHGELNFSAGKVRGNLMSTVVGLNFWTVINLYLQRNAFYSGIKERYENRQSK